MNEPLTPWLQPVTVFRLWSTSTPTRLVGTAPSISDLYKSPQSSTSSLVKVSDVLSVSSRMQRSSDEPFLWLPPTVTMDDAPEALA
jgi:hypothetical protein